MTSGPMHALSRFVSLIGGRVEEWREGYVRLALTIEPHHTNPHGVMHGGVITTLMDEAVGGVIASVREPDAMWKAPHAMVDMNASFMAAARAGDEILVEARVLKLGKTVAFGEAEVRKRGAEDGLAGKGRFAFTIMRRSR